MKKPKFLLTSFQREWLAAIGGSELKKHLVWSGGTALNFAYETFRLSEDLDFLSRELLPGDYLLTHIRSLAKKLRVTKIEEQHKFNRHQIFVQRNKDSLKVEIVYYPFPPLRKPKLLGEFGLRVDALEDIAANKAHALFERVEPKDVVDVYVVLKKLKISIPALLKLTQKKFGTEIDPALFAAKALEVAEHLKSIRPLLLKNITAKEIKEFFQEQGARYLKKQLA